MPREPVEFVDKSRLAADSFYELCAKVKGTKPIFIKKQLQGLIQEDPNFLESYLLLSEILFEKGKDQEEKKY